MIAANERGRPRVYIAGPMRGLPYFNFPAFDKAKRIIEAQGFLAVSPAEFDRQWGFEPYDLPANSDWSSAEKCWPDFNLEDAIRRDLDAVISCDAVAILPGWTNSRGAMAEVALANWLGMEVFEITFMELER